MAFNPNTIRFLLERISKPDEHSFSSVSKQLLNKQPTFMDDNMIILK